MLSSILTDEMVNALALTDRQIGLLADAVRIFENFLKDILNIQIIATLNIPKCRGESWCFITTGVVDKIRAILVTGEDFDVNLFKAAQEECFQGMDLFPRFKKVRCCY